MSVFRLFPIVLADECDERGGCKEPNKIVRKTELLAYLASAYASYARFQVTQKDAYLSALRAGLKAHDNASQVYALDPNYYDILALQEPYLDSQLLTRANSSWVVVYPTTFDHNRLLTRSILLIHKDIYHLFS